MFIWQDQFEKLTFFVDSFADDTVSFTLPEQKPMKNLSTSSCMGTVNRNKLDIF